MRRVLTVHDVVSELYPRSMSRYNALVHRFLFRRSVELADRIIADSESTKRDLVDRLGVKEPKVCVIHLAADSVFRPLSSVRVSELLQSLGVAGDYLLAVGTIEPRKNYTLLFRVLARLPETTRLVIAGRRGWGYQGILSEIDKLKIRHRVHLLSYIPTDNLVALYCAARCLVMPSLYEGFGLPVLQAMASGTPVIASRSSSLPEVGGNAAIYFSPTSVDSLEKEILRLYGDAALRAELRERGLARAQLFSWGEAAKRTMAVLRDCSLNGDNQDVGQHEPLNSA